MTSTKQNKIAHEKGIPTSMEMGWQTDLITINEIFQDLIESVADVKITIRIGRSIMKCEDFLRFQRYSQTTDPHYILDRIDNPTPK